MQLSKLSSLCLALLLTLEPSVAVSLESFQLTKESWIDLTSVKNPRCDLNKGKVCTITNNGRKFKVLLKPEQFKDGSKTQLRLDSLQIQEVSSPSSEPEIYHLEQTGFLPTNEFFELYQVRMRPTGETDLALYAYSSAHEGPMYYYFLYDPRKKIFAMTDLPMPKLAYDEKSGLYLSEIQERPFEIKRNRIEEVDESQDEANRVPVYPAQQ